MEKNTQGLVAVFAVLSLLIGFSLGAVLMGEDTETIKEIEVEKIVNVSVDKVVEVIVPTMDISLYLDEAVEDFMEYVDDEELFVCEGYEYDFDEISISKIYNDYTVAIDGDDYTVGFNVKLRYDEDDERSCKKSFEILAEYEDGEEVEISIIE